MSYKEILEAVIHEIERRFKEHDSKKNDYVSFDLDHFWRSLEDRDILSFIADLQNNIDPSSKKNWYKCIVELDSFTKGKLYEVETDNQELRWIQDDDGKIWKFDWFYQERFKPAKKKEIDELMSPKFSVDDLITDGNTTVKIVSMQDYAYVVTSEEIENDANQVTWIIKFEDQGKWSLKPVPKKEDSKFRVKLTSDPLTSSFRDELEEMCNQLLGGVDYEWMEGEIGNVLGTSTWLELCKSVTEQFIDGLLELADKELSSKVWHDGNEKGTREEAILFHSTFDNKWYVFHNGNDANWNVIDKWAYLKDLTEDRTTRRESDITEVPSFKIGDKIKHKKENITATITDIKNGEYILSGCCGTHLPIEWQGSWELVKDEFESGSIEERKKNPIEYVKGFMSGSKWKTNKLAEWLKSESDFLLEECKAGRGDLAKQYRGELYREIIAKLKDMTDDEDREVPKSS